MTDFYPRPPRGGRPWHDIGAGGFLQISIHALREEGDFDADSGGCSATIFLSTPSARRATVLFPIRTFLIFISIHALREEGDQMVNRYVAEVPISIHALREEGD